MSPDELDELARRLADAKNRDEAARLSGEIAEGFYAETSDAGISRDGILKILQPLR